MFRGIDGVRINSDNAKALAEFYRDKVGLEMTNEFEGEDGSKGYEFSFKNGPSFNVHEHSDIKGKNEDAPRFFINYEVNDLEREAERLEKESVKVIQELYHVEGYGLIATYEDPDGNYFQLVQVRPTESE